MRFSTIAVAAAAAGSAAAQSMTEEMTVCDKYTSALFPNNNTAANQFTLVALLVKTAVIGNFTGNGTANPSLPGSMNNVPGILAEEGGLAKYFNGELLSTNRNNMPVSVNFLDGQSNTSMLVEQPLFIGSEGSNQATLFAHLVTYFGSLLSCSGYGSDDFPAYAGSNSQYNVHKYMALSETEHSYFIHQVGLAATSFGVTMEDVTTVANSLNMTFGYRCAPAVMVIPDTQPMQQVICQGSTCPLAEEPEAGCSGDAAVAGFTPVAAATAAPSDMSSMASMTGSASATGTASRATTGTGALASATSAAGSAASSGASAATGAAPRQTAAAGLLAGVAGVAAMLI